MKVLIMGLGLHGGGLESARYVLRQGAELTITDLRDAQTLAPSIEQLELFLQDTSCKGASIRYVLGKHEIDDFIHTDIVIKNPGVRSDSPFLKAARRIETDISLFLNAIGDSTAAADGVRLTAVTGSKGKSSVASALHWVLAQNGPSRLGGNITVSPLTFVDELQKNDDVVLELSSWQLGDLRGRRKADGSPLLKPKAAVLTVILPDHLDYYGSMESYVADKRVIYQGQGADDVTVAKNDDWGRSFLAETSASPLIFSETPLPAGVTGGWFDDPAGPGFARLSPQGPIVELVPAQLLVPGRHQKHNMLAAGLTLCGLGLEPSIIREGIGSFPGIEHRLERFHQAGGIDFYNDSAATIPEAAASAVAALSADKRLILVTGGTDKNLDFAPLVQAAGQAKAIILLAGTGSEKLRALLADAGIAYVGPFDDLDKAVTTALAAAAPGEVVALSPGCASFGMFRNEFDRGRKWKEAIRLGTGERC